MWNPCVFSVEEKFAQAVCFLLVDLYLLTFQPEKALHLLAVLDKISAQGSNKNGKGEVGSHSTLLLFCSERALVLFYLLIEVYLTHSEA